MKKLNLDFAVTRSGRGYIHSIERGLVFFTTTSIGAARFTSKADAQALRRAAIATGIPADTVKVLHIGAKGGIFS